VVRAFLEEADEKIADGILKRMPGTLRPSLRKYKENLRGLSERVGDSKFLKNNNIETKDGRKLIDIVKDNDAAHLRRTYRIFEDEKYVPTQESIEAADSFFTANKKFTEKTLTEIARKDVNERLLPKEFLTKNGLKKTEWP
jgi:hypothetical protein